jgi:hypothetical protein
MSGGVCLPHLRVMGVWRERLRDGILRGDTNRALDGGATPWGTVALPGAGVDSPAPADEATESGKCRSRCTVTVLLFYRPAHQQY